MQHVSLIIPYNGWPLPMEWRLPSPAWAAGQAPGYYGSWASASGNGMDWRAAAAGAAYPICPLVGLALVMEMENAEDVPGSQPRQRGTLAVQPYTGGLWKG